MVGFITLFGIAVRNGILLVNHYRHLVEIEGLAMFDAIVQGSSERLVPILMTALTATLFMPGATGEANPPPSQFKMRLFPGGEYLPGGREAWIKGLGWLAPARHWIDSIGNLGSGKERVLMTINGHPFVIPVCSEILHSESAGVFMKSPDGRQPLIVTIANEGRFHRNHSIMVCQMAMVFRAVEARTTVARSANAGISGFVDPAGRYKGLVTNEEGRHFTRLGAPDAAAIDQVLKFRDTHGMETIAADSELTAEMQRLVAEVERLRSIAGISGFSIENTSTTSDRTLYQLGGRHFPNLVLFAFVLFLVIALCRPREA